MTSKKLYFILLGVIALLFVGLIAGAYGVNKMLGQEATKLDSLKAKELALQQEQIGLKSAKKSIQQYADLENIAHSIVPEDKNQAESVREIANIAATNGISLASINFPASTLGNKASGSSATSSSSSSNASAAPAASSTKTLSQLQSVKNIPGVYQLVITVSSDSQHPVPYYQFINFLSSLEHNRRTAQVSSITLQPDTKNHNNLSFTLTLNEYIKP